MEFADYGMYADDGDHHIDLRNPHFRQEAYLHMQHQQPQHTDFFPHHMQHPHFAQHLASLAVDVKPRLTKEQHDILENHYQGQNKPNTQTKKGFAEGLGVSLDKVNDWFQNRRAKSKQDAKKAAGQFGQQAQNQTQAAPSSQASVHSQASNDDLSAQFLASEYLNSPHTTDSACHIDPMSLSNGLGITQQSAPTTMSPQDMLHTKTADATPANLKVESMEDTELHRRTLTQEEFDSFAHGNEYKVTSSTLHESPKQDSDPFDKYFNDMSTFGTGMDSSDMQPEFSVDAFGSTSSLFPDVTSAAVDLDPQRNASTHSSVSDWSEHSTPSLNITPALPPDSGYGASENEISPRAKSIASSTSSAQWQPGSSVPCDFEAMEREFKEIAARNNSDSTSGGNLTRRNSSIPFADQQFALANEQMMPQAEAPASLTQSMNNMGLSGETSQSSTPRGNSITSALGGGIAARRQRPRPQPLAASSLRSASYCGPLPTAPGMSTSNNPPPTAPTLRRIKSSNVMNGGIANGRIQKSVSGAQRSPLNFTFAEAMNSPKFTRRTSSYSPANGGLMTSSLAPPTPLSPTELSHRLELQRQTSQIFGAHQMSRQPSINELREESHQSMLSAGKTFTSPPTTPNYAAHFARNRMNSGMMENTPPQSAPASQQCFPNMMFSQAPQMQAALSQGMMQSGQQAYVPVMSNEYPMQNMVMSSQQPLQAGQYLEMLQAQQQQLSGMSQPIPMAYSTNMFGPSLSAQQITPPNIQYPYMSGSTGSGVLLSQPQIHHGQSKSVPAADFYVHEYSPPQEVKRVLSPRKGNDAGPKNYTFANHGPEHFEKTKKDRSASPGSSSGHSSSS